MLTSVHDAISAVGTLVGHFSKRVMLAFVASLVLAVGAIGTAVTTEARIQADLDGLPSYITEDMVSEARSMQAHYGHPAGCTIAQIIAESSYQGDLSQLAKEDHNLFGMKWANSSAGCDGVVGPTNWDTNEEYDGQYVQINDAFIEFESDKACIKFRSAVFLQASTYADNALIQQAIAERSSTLMARGSKTRAGATDSSFTPTSSSRSWTNTTYIVWTYRYDVESIPAIFQVKTKAAPASGEPLSSCKPSSEGREGCDGCFVLEREGLLTTGRLQVRKRPPRRHQWQALQP